MGTAVVSVLWGLGEELIGTNPAYRRSFVVHRGRLQLPLKGFSYSVPRVYGPSRLSMRALLPHFVEMEQRHGSVIRALRVRAASARSSEAASGARYSLLVSFRRGMQTPIGRLIERLPGSVVQRGMPVASIERDPDRSGWLLRLADGQVLQAARSAWPCRRSGRLRSSVT